MTARTAWTLERLPSVAARGPNAAADCAPDCAVFTLASSSAFSVDVKRGRGVELLCRSGLVHATFEGDPLDHILREGESLRVDGPGRLAVSALDPSRVELRPATRLGRASGSRSGARADP